MSKWTSARIAMAVAVMAWGCSMAESTVSQPKPLDGMKEVPSSEASKKLDGEVIALLGNKYAITSATYYQVPGEIPWIAVSKWVQNQMAEKQIQRKMIEGAEPGIDFVDLYPQGKNGGAFAVAMPKGTKSSAEKLVGYYALGAGKK